MVESSEAANILLFFMFFLYLVLTMNYPAIFIRDILMDRHFENCEIEGRMNMFYSHQEIHTSLRVRAFQLYETIAEIV